VIAIEIPDIRNQTPGTGRLMLETRGNKDKYKIISKCYTVSGRCFREGTWGRDKKRADPRNRARLQKNRGNKSAGTRFIGNR